MTLERDCLNEHNKFRAMHGVPPLKLNDEISIGCSEYAKVLAKKGILEHAKQNKFGENLYAMTSTNAASLKVDTKEAVRQWYNEISQYDFRKAVFMPQTGHFTQVVWKGSEELGIGYAKQDGMVVVVARYYPPGNYLNKFTENVFPIQSTAPSKTSSETETEETEVPIAKFKSMNINKNVQIDNFREDCLKAHNEFRRIHQVDPLELDGQMCEYSQNWAEKLSKMDKLQGSGNDDYGENIFLIRSSDTSFTIDGAKSINHWYEESKDYDYRKEPTAAEYSKCANFAQIVWKDTKKLGVGFVSKNGENYVVCNYFPRGNYYGGFIKNILPPLK